MPPHIVFADGGEGCQGVALEAVLSTTLYHYIQVIPGIGLDLEVVPLLAAMPTHSNLCVHTLYIYTAGRNAPSGLRAEGLGCRA